ncbi:low specificity L-threonine aldolase [Deferribacterales bacterium RsTz2092]|nr:threonine aldolase [Deferribacterales bacterium]
MDNTLINFASDNSSAVHPVVLERLSTVNSGAVSSYGNDIYTEEAIKRCKLEFGTGALALSVFNGTGANTIALDIMADKYSMVLVPAGSHLISDECGAPARATGCDIAIVTEEPRKLTPNDLLPFMQLKGNIHKSQPKIVAIAQLTERGEAYSLDELKALRDFCDEHHLFLYIDGARLANATVALGSTLSDAAFGADIFSLGGTKNGFMAVETLIIRNLRLAGVAPYIRKQLAQLASKMRYLSAQVLAMFEGELWRANAAHANKMMQLLYEGIKDVSGIAVERVPSGNMMFVNMPEKLAEHLLKTFYFYVEKISADSDCARFVTSWDTKVADVEHLIAELKASA